LTQWIKVNLKIGQILGRLLKIVDKLLPDKHQRCRKSGFLVFVKTVRPVEADDNATLLKGE